MMLYSFITVLGLLCPTSVFGWKTADFSKYPECNLTSVDTQTVPKLGKRFTLKVEGKNNGPKSFFDSDGYYSADDDQGSTTITNHGQRSFLYYSFADGNAFTVENRTCKKDELYHIGCNTYALFIAEIASFHKVSDKCNISADNITSLGVQNDTVRGIQVQKWSHCVQDGDKTPYLNNYYYSAPNVSSPMDAGSKPVPIRFEAITLDGPKKNSSYVYDFTYYMPEVQDDAVFLPPDGVYCPEWSRENKTLPLLPGQFSLTLLSVVKQRHELHSIKLNFDYKNRLVSFITDSLNGTHFPPGPAKNHTLYRIVHDYNSNASFSMPVENWITGGKSGGCIIGGIDKNSLDWDSDNSTAMHLRQASEMFGMGEGTWLYVGVKNFNNLPTSVWITQYNTSTLKVTTEAYWLNESWTTGNEPIFTGLVTYTTDLNGNNLETVRTFVSDYRTFPFHWRIFDVDTCLKDDNQQLITFTLRVTNYTEVASRLSSFETVARNTVANITNTSPIRFTDITVDKGPENNTAQIWLTVLNWTSTQTSKRIAPQLSAQDIIDRLKTKFDQNDFTMNVTFASKTQVVTFVKGSLKYGKDIIKSTTVRPKTTTVPPTAQPIISDGGYTGGSMAGLAIAMIIIGGVAGLVAGFLLWKRNTGIAYQVYD